MKSMQLSKIGMHICKDADKLKKRFEKLNRNYLKPGEVVFIQNLIGDKMEAMLRTLTYDD